MGSDWPRPSCRTWPASASASGRPSAAAASARARPASAISSSTCFSRAPPLRSAARISQEVEGLGGYINACTSEESTCYHARAHAGHAAKLMDVLADMYLNPVFDRQEITRERRVIKEEIAMTLDQPSQHVLELSDESLWPDQPLGRSIAGDERTLNRTRRRELAGFHARHYVSGSTVVVAAGDIRHRDLLDLAKRLARAHPHRQALELVSRRERPGASGDQAVHPRHGADAVCARHPHLFTARPKALCPALGQCDPRREHELAPLPVHPRGARFGLQHLLDTQLLSRHRQPHDRRRAGHRPHAKGTQADPRRAAPPPRQTARRRASCAAPATTSSVSSSSRSRAPRAK